MCKSPRSSGSSKRLVLLGTKGTLGRAIGLARSRGGVGVRACLPWNAREMLRVSGHRTDSILNADRLTRAAAVNTEKGARKGAGSPRARLELRPRETTGRGPT